MKTERKYTTSCFARVGDVEKRKDLIRWCECEIGRNGGFPVGADWITGEFVLCINDVTYCCNRGELISMIDGTTIDCGENIELFKALAQKNDNIWDRQYVIDNAGNVGLCELTPVVDTHGAITMGRVVTMSGTCFNIDNYRRATAEEIIEYFKTREK